jgi:TRAP-type uncharacterized transport system fused permease subunit
MAAFAVPYFFVYDPAILGIDVTPLQIIASFITAILGGICASAAMMGFFRRRLTAPERLAFAITAVLFMNSDWRVDLAALLVLAALVAWTARGTTTSADQDPKAGDKPAETNPKGDLL